MNNIPNLSKKDRTNLLKQFDKYQHILDEDNILPSDEIPFLDTYYIFNRIPVICKTLETVDEAYDDYVPHFIEKYQNEEFSTDFSKWKNGNLSTTEFVTQHESKLAEILEDDINRHIFTEAKEYLENL